MMKNQYREQDLNTVMMLCVRERRWNDRFSMQMLNENRNNWLQVKICRERSLAPPPQPRAREAKYKKDILSRFVLVMFPEKTKIKPWLFSGRGVLRTSYPWIHAPMTSHCYSTGFEINFLFIANGSRRRNTHLLR